MSRISKLFVSFPAMSGTPTIAAVLAFSLISSLTFGTFAAAEAPKPIGHAQPTDEISYLDNGQIRLGADLDLGGSITWLSAADSDRNLVNNHDWGRQIQMSFYSGPTPFVPAGATVSPNWEKLGWNPIQSGDYAGFRSEIVEHRNDGRELYVKSIPKIWPLKDVPGECTFELTVRLVDNTAEVVCRLNNHRADETQYQGRSQELPAVYTVPQLWRLMTYSGDKPFTGDELTQVPAKFMWSKYRSNENWSALVNDDDYGIGLWTPGKYDTIGGFHGQIRVGGPDSGNTGYFSPLATEILDHNITYEYRYTLILGQLDEIRDYIYQRADRPSPPQYRFDTGRAHWVYNNDAKDQGWPIRGQLDVRATGPNPVMIGPASFWRAEDAPQLLINAAFAPGVDTVRVGWETLDGRGMKSERMVQITVDGDGQFRTYRVDLSRSPNYQGPITRLYVSPVVSGATRQQLSESESPAIRVKTIGFDDQSSVE